MTRNDSISQATPIVYVVDDDISVRESLEWLVRCAGWHPKTFASANEFLRQPPALVPHCLVLNATLPDMNGLELQSRISLNRMDMPIIFMSAYGDVAMAVRAMKAGAAEFLTKPFRDEALLTALQQAIDRSRAVLGYAAEIRPLRERYASLSRRQREVMGLVIEGRLNKQVAYELGISEITVKAHRGSMMRRMKANSLADLVGIAGRLGVESGSKMNWQTR